MAPEPTGGPGSRRQAADAPQSDGGGADERTIRPETSRLDPGAPGVTEPGQRIQSKSRSGRT